MSVVKTPEQTEFCELFETLKASGWKHAQLARHLQLTESAVSMILKGKTGISDMRLGMIRELVNNQEKARQHVDAIESKTLPMEQLQYLQDHDPGA